MPPSKTMWILSPKSTIPITHIWVLLLVGGDHMEVIHINMYFTSYLFSKHDTTMFIGVEMLPDTIVLFQPPSLKKPYGV